MQTVLMAKDDLTHAVTANREQHQRDYEESVEGYHRAQVKEAARVMTACGIQSWKDDGTMVRVVVDGIIDEMTFRPSPLPRSHDDEYQRALSMLELDQRAQIELTQDEFRNLVLDEWNWSTSFKAVSTRYKVLGG